MTTDEAPALCIHLRNFGQTGADFAGMLRTAEVADAAGIDRVLVSDHVLLGERLDEYGRPELGGASGKAQPTDPDGHWLEPLTVLAAVAGRTSRVRLGTAVLLAALRTPAVLAKQLATLDVISGGRLDVGVGVGWQREEYEASGLDFERRGVLLDETLDVCRALWTQDRVTADIGRFTFDRVHQFPHPVGPQGVPIWISGRPNRAVIRRLIAHGTGWIPWDEHESDPGPGIQMVRTALQEAGRDPGKLRVLGRVRVGIENGRLDVTQLLDDMRRLTTAGVTDIHLGGEFGQSPERDGDLMNTIVTATRTEL